MPRPDFITDDDIDRWTEQINKDYILSDDIKKSALFREIYYASCYVEEELIKLKCPYSLIDRILSSIGKASFGSQDTWEVHLRFLEDYKNNILNFEPEPNINLN